MAAPVYKITREIGVIEGDNNGWDKHLTLGKWGDGEEKYNLRVHSPDGKVGKGLSLTYEELLSLYDIIEEELDRA